jgi:Fe2+ or Zn2+ uptake regulation protein
MTVDQIAKARGVTKRYAYSILRKAQAAKMDVPVPTNQRELILTILHRSGDYIRNTDMLSEAVHETGSKLPPHDVTKVLWSLQKTQHVRFRERANGMLYAIKLTAEGKKAAIKLTTDHLFEPDDNELLPTDAGTMSTVEEIVTEVGPDGQDEAYARVDEHIAKVVEGARKLQEEVNALGAGPKPGNSGPGSDEDWGPTLPEQQDPPVPWFRGNLGGWPSIRSVRDRHLKAVKIRAAAALLEEAGEDDTVLALLDKITFTPLEEEVVQLLRFLKEIE